MLRELGGAILLGVLLGVPMSWLSGRLRGGELTLVEALGMVLLCGGMAMWLEVSYLLSAVTLGATVANMARHHERPFQAISHIEHPFLILFFVLAGTSLQPAMITGFGLLGVGYIGFRIVGRVLGGWLGCQRTSCPAGMNSRIGWTLMPQAGVAIGMALIVQQRLPELGDLIMPVVIGSTVLFEIFGPVMTRYAIRQASSR
jgi:Kef-type K+ transport system membrane component KefB